MHSYLKKLIVGLFLIVTCIAIYSFFKDFSDSYDKRIDARQVEIVGSKLFGYKDGVLSYRVKADYMSHGRSKYLYSAKKVSEGSVFDSDGVMVINDIQADSIRINTKSKTLAVYDNVTFRFLPKESNSQENDIFVQADELRYFDSNKSSYLSNNVEMRRKEAAIFPSTRVEVDHDTNIATIGGLTYMTIDDFQVTANQMIIYIDDNLSVIRKGIHILRKGRLVSANVDEREKKIRALATVMKSEELLYSDNHDNELITANRGVLIQQKGKQVRADKAFYNKNKKLYQIEGDINISLDSLDWIIDKSKKPEFLNKDVKETVQMSVSIKADKLIFDANTKNLTLIGNVSVKQENKRVMCHKIEYDDRRQLLSFMGNVEAVIKGHDTVKTQLLTIDLKNETFEAGGRVSTEFKVTKRKNKQ